MKRYLVNFATKITKYPTLTGLIANSINPHLREDDYNYGEGLGEGWVRVLSATNPHGKNGDISTGYTPKQVLGEGGEG